MKAEQLFFNYAFPCAQVLLDLGKIDQNTYTRLKSQFYSQQTPGRAELQKIFVNGYRRLSIVAEGLHKQPWDEDVIRKYFLQEHNSFIDQGEGEYAKFPESFKYICKVYKAKVIAREGHILTVQYNKTTVKVLAPNLTQAKKGDLVSIHLGFAIEII